MSLREILLVLGLAFPPALFLGVLLKLKVLESVVALVLMTILSTVGLYFMKQNIIVHRMVDPAEAEQYHRSKVQP